MISDFFFQLNDSLIQPEDVHLVLHGSGDIQPTNIHDLARAGFTAHDGRASNIMVGKDPTGKSCFIMYVSEIKEMRDLETTERTHYAGHTITEHVKYVIYPKQGTMQLHKFYSADGSSWTTWPDPPSPQSVWLESGSEAVYEDFRIKMLPIPYSDEFGAVFGYKDPPVGPSGPTP